MVWPLLWYIMQLTLLTVVVDPGFGKGFVTSGGENPPGQLPLYSIQGPGWLTAYSWLSVHYLHIIWYDTTVSIHCCNCLRIEYRNRKLRKKTLIIIITVIAAVLRMIKSVSTVAGATRYPLLCFLLILESSTAGTRLCLPIHSWYSVTDSTEMAVRIKNSQWQCSAKWNIECKYADDTWCQGSYHLNWLTSDSFGYSGCVNINLPCRNKTVEYNE